MSATTPPLGETPEFRPFIAPEAQMKELTVRAVAIGALLGIVFAASSVYLGLKVGITVSASIPVAVLSITLFKWAAKAFKLREATILENNISQTTGSAGESIAAGVAFTLPSLLLMGFEMELVRILLVSLLGGLIGVLMMIPLRHGLIVKEHGKLMYPEGTACADVLIVGERGGTSAATVFLGFFVGLFYAVLNVILRVWPEAATFGGKVVTFWGKLKGATLAFEVSPPMLGVGYIIGPRVACTTMAGGALAYLILVPLVKIFGDSMPTPMYPSTLLIAEMSTGQIRNAYILYIGAGAVATGGFIGLARSIPTIIGAFAGGLRSLSASQGGARGGADAGPDTSKRTEQDLSMKIVLGGSLAIAAAIAVAPILEINALAAVLIVVFGFFFVTVSSRITGEIGSSSNPISGMTIATLLITCGLFVLLGWVGVGYKAMALSTAALVCVAASNGGTISQDLKTGFLVGATPRLQQISILVGVVTSGLVIGVVMRQLDAGSTTFQAVEMSQFTPDLSSSTQTGKGPDGKDYRVLYMKEDVGPIEPGTYLVDDAGNYVHRIGLPARFDAFTPELAADADTITGPDQKSYRVFSSEGGEVPAGDYLVGEDGKIAWKLSEPASFPGLAANVPPDAPRRTGPDGKEYAVVGVATQVPGVLRGKYLVDETGKIAFAVDPSISRDYPFRLEPWTKGAQTLPVPADAATERGLDRKPYKVVAVKKSTGQIAQGRYLVDDAGSIAFVARDVPKFDAPKAQLFRLIIDGTLGGKLPWGLVLVGMFLAIMMELVGVSSLPFAVGIYLPFATSGGIFVGGMVRWLVDRRMKTSAAEAEFSPGMLMASGLIAGGAIAGVLNSVVAASPRFTAATDVPGRIAGFVSAEGDFASKVVSLLHNEGWWPMLPFLGMAFLLYRVGIRKDPVA